MIDLYKLIYSKTDNIANEHLYKSTSICIKVNTLKNTIFHNEINIKFNTII